MNSNKQSKEKIEYGMFKVTKFMLRTAWNKRKRLIINNVIIVVIAVLLSLCELFVTPTILGELQQGANTENVIVTILFFSILIIILNALKAYYNEAIRSGKIEVRLDIMQMLNNKKALMSYPLTEDESIIKKHEKAENTTGANDSASEAIWLTLTDVLTAFFLLLIYIILLTNVNVIMISVVSITCALSYFVCKKINNWGYRHTQELEELQNKVNYAQKKSEDVEFAKDIRIFGMKQWMDDMYYAATSLLRGFRIKAEKKYIKADFIDLLLTFARNAIAYIYLINLSLSAEITASEFLLYFSAISAFSAMLVQFLSQMTELQKKSIELRSVLEFLNLKEVFKFEDGKSITPDNNKEYEIKLNNVSFKYPEAEKYTLKNINLTLKPGEKLAVVGLNGAGKTTLVKLMCGYYDPSEGEVLLNGEDIINFNRRDYYKFFTAVFQEFSLLAGTIAQNVAQNGKKIDIERVKDSLEKAGLTKKIISLEKGVETNILRDVYEDGIELSGGETQRLMLARALYKNAPIIVLDEPTAALDPLAESDIYNKYNEMTKGKSSVYISHRLASTRFCDKIILIDTGEIKEEGTHDELIALNGIYANLFEVQSKYYKEGESIDE